MIYKKADNCSSMKKTKEQKRKRYLQPESALPALPCLKVSLFPSYFPNSSPKEALFSTASVISLIRLTSPMRIAPQRRLLRK